ncbi:MAG: Diguanylate phosphodiesterase, partial [Frankiales bacterium]|nr:Diguanylate phosphodiesterase [Frankiales bacterium]
MRAGNRVNGGKVDTLEPEDKVSSSGEARRRPVLLLIISLALAAAVLYALRVSDDPVEVFLDLLMALLGLLAAGLASYERLRASRLLAGRAERHLDVMRTADVLPWECDAGGNVTFVGERITEHFGYQPAEALRLNLRDVVHPLEHDRLATLTADGSGWTQATWRCLRADGSERWMSSTAMPNRAADGTLLGFTGATYP